MTQHRRTPTPTTSHRYRLAPQPKVSTSSQPAGTHRITGMGAGQSIQTKPELQEPGPGAKPSQGVFIAVMGATGSGKTSFINVASGSALRVGSGLTSCTDAVQTSEPFWLENRLVRLIDTPGFDDTAKTDTEVLTMIAAFLSSMYRRGVMLSGAIYIHRISDIRMGGTSTRNFKLFRGLCGETMLRNVVIVTNMWGEVTLDPVLERGAQLKRHYDTPASAHAIVGCVASKTPRALRIQRELVDEQRVITETTAGAELGRELHEQAMKFKEERRRLQDEMDEALRQKDDQAREELEQATAELDQEMLRVQTDSQQLASCYASDKARLKKMQQDLETAAQQESERQAAEHRRRMADIDDRIRRTPESESRETMHLAARLRRLQRQQAEPARRRPRRGLWDDFLDFLSVGQH
ncbi:hypothetical protein PC9H_010601 [Pleurotus ostreatus]|uniref:G domain-containing protein n=1 Tax=Pleurotus ostreatus TaxID=5322 RepID=A0A8H7DPV9_PLEOS|nr:uncharacterized protein PC9H_010601 [Pleurotus ostreatus]KAF7422445.1 hypothetical protein PC9H_010601 [Pleurotus ostreatus]